MWCRCLLKLHNRTQISSLLLTCEFFSHQSFFLCVGLALNVKLPYNFLSWRFLCIDICLHSSKLLVVDLFDFRWSNSNLILTSSCIVFGGWSCLLFSGHKIALCGLFSGSLDVKTWGLHESWSGHGWTRTIELDIGAWWISRCNKLMQLSLHCQFRYACEVVPIFWQGLTFSLPRSNYPLGYELLPFIHYLIVSRVKYWMSEILMIEKTKKHIWYGRTHWKHMFKNFRASF